MKSVLSKLMVQERANKRSGPPFVHPSQPSNNINQDQEDRDLDQGAYRVCQSLITFHFACGNGNSYGKFEVVAGSSGALPAAELISKTQFLRNCQGGEEDDGKVDDKRRRDPEHGDDLLDHPPPLRSKENGDGEEQAYQGKWPDRGKNASRTVPGQATTSTRTG